MIPTVRHDRALCAGSTSPGSFPVAYSINLGRYPAYHGDKELYSDLTIQICLARGMEHKAALKSSTTTQNLSGPLVVEKTPRSTGMGSGLRQSAIYPCRRKASGTILHKLINAATASAGPSDAKHRPLAPKYLDSHRIAGAFSEI